jgi:hypothetical protein
MKWKQWRPGSGAGETSTSGKSISQRAKFNQSPGCMAAFFGVFLLAGLGFLMIFAVPAWKVVAARGWTPVECEILSSSVGSHSGDDGATYSIDVSFRYIFDSVEYSSDRYQFLGGSSSGYGGKKEVVDGLPEGSSTTCYVDPDDPSEAVLYRGFSWFYLFALFPLLFVAVGGGGMAWALSSGRGAAKGVEADGFREVDSWSTPVAPAGPVELEESISPMGKLGCLIGLCILWNGVVSIFVWTIWSEWRAGGSFNGCMAVFLTPFVLVGLAILVGIPYQFLALANPRPRLTLSRVGVPLGGSAQLDWSFRGSTRRLRDLRIWIVGSEKATYRRGTTTHTDTEIFAEIEVVKIESGQPLAAGSATLEIPEDTMHSFEAPNNKIVWVLKLNASIGWWPDVITEFPFVIEPGKGDS